MKPKLSDLVHLLVRCWKPLRTATGLGVADICNFTVLNKKKKNRAVTKHKCLSAKDHLPAKQLLYPVESELDCNQYFLACRGNI